MKRRKAPPDHRVHILTITEIADGKPGPENVLYRGVGQDKDFTVICRAIVAEYRPLLISGRARLRIEVIITS